jgi:hypothetical protein
MHAANENGSFAVANQRNPMAVDTVNHSMWSYAGTHNPMSVNDNFKLVDPRDSAATVDYSDFTVDGQPVYTAKMAMDLGSTFGSDYPAIDVRVGTDSQTGAYIITESSPLWRCTTDGAKLWSSNCGDVIKAPVEMTRITTLQPTGTSYYIEDSYISTDSNSHTLVTASEMYSTSAANLQFKITAGIEHPMANFDYVAQSQNIVGTGSTMKILTKFDGAGDVADNTVIGSASFSPSPTRFVTAKTGPNDTSAHGMNVVYADQVLPANGHAVTLRQAYTVARDDSTAQEASVTASAFLSSGRSVLGQRISVDSVEDRDFSDATTTIRGSSTASLPIAYSSTTPRVCSVGSSTLNGQVSQATVTFAGAGTCHINAAQPGNDYFLAATSQTEFSVRLSAPSLPRNVTSVISGSKATINWLEPENSGGSAISKYVVTATSGVEIKTVTVNRVGNGVTPTSAIFTTLRQGVTYQVTVTATNVGVGSQTELTSSASRAVSVKLPTVIYVSGLKWTVVGNKPVKVGNTLSATKGTWAGAGITYKYEWYRCAKIYSTPGTTGVATTVPKTGAGKCVVIAKATAATYKLVAADKGKFIVLSTKAVNAGLAAGVTMYTKSTEAVK